MLGIAQTELARQWTSTAGTSPITKLVQWLYQLTFLLIMFSVLFWDMHTLVQLKMSNSAFPCTHHHIIHNRNNTRTICSPLSVSLPRPPQLLTSTASPVFLSQHLRLLPSPFTLSFSRCCFCLSTSTLFYSRVFYSIAVPPSSSRLLSWLSLSLY